ncbi:MAG: sugar transferase [Ignavibacteriaceae bacterium]
MIGKICALIFILLLFPAFAIISFILFLQSGQSPLFIQERGLSLKEWRFKIYKFRTLTPQTESFATNRSSLIKDSESNLLKLGHQVYVSRFGKYLRKTGLDEAPQLINILKGEMNFVGPRPLDLEDLKNIKNEFPFLYREREETNLKPGLTGYWQIYKDDERSIGNLIALDKYYFENKSFLLDLNLILKSFLISISGKHKDAIVDLTFDSEKEVLDSSLNEKRPINCAREVFLLPQKLFKYF